MLNSSRWQPSAASALMLSALLLLAGCSRLRSSSSAEYVYVTAKKMYLLDRVAVVANHVGEVTNGERLLVLEHGRRFLKVQTPTGAVGWLEEHAAIDQSEFNNFGNLSKTHASERPVANAVLYNELYVHLTPGRKTQRFYLFPANTKVSMLERASVPRVAPGSVLGLPAGEAKPQTVVHSSKTHKQNFVSQFLSPVPMEDWWLVRDGAGHTGWMLSRDLQVDVPESVAQYAENEKMVGAYVLRTVEDPDSGTGSSHVPEYLTVLTPYKEGLPFDFDQVRVFTWDTHRHRYGTAFRQHNVVGFFPVKVAPGTPDTPSGPEPEFSFQVAAGDAVSLDPTTGMPHAAQLETVTYRMAGNLVRKVLLPGTQASVKTDASAVRRRPRHGKKRHAQSDR